MASKKEHNRKQKSKPRPDAPEETGEERLLPPGMEINSLDLLSAAYNVPKASEGGAKKNAAKEPSAEADPAEAARRAAEEVAAARAATEEAEREREAAARAEAARREAEAREAMAAAARRREAEAEELARREAEAAERRRAAAEARRRAEEEEERLRAEAAAAQRKREEEETARRLAAEELRRAEAEEAARARRKEEEKRAAEEAERKAAEARQKAAEEEKVAREAAARQAAEETERRRREVETAERARVAEEVARREREEAARQAAAAEQAAREDAARQAAEAERKATEIAARQAAAEAERRAAEIARAEAEVAAKAAAIAAEARAAAAERARKMAEEAENARRMAEKVDRERREREEAERKHMKEVEEERHRQEEAAAVRAREMAEAAEKTRLMREAIERERREGEERDRAAVAAAAALPPIPPAPQLEVDNPHWQKQQDIFESLSGAPHGSPAPDYAEPDYAGAVAQGPALAVTMAGAAPEEQRPHVYEGPSDGAESTASGSPAHSTVPVPKEKRMYIVMVTPEVAPCAKVGGLGDVILGLGRELMKRGHGVEVVCPMYSSMRYDLIHDLHEEYGELWCPHNNEWRAEKVFQGKVDGDLQVNFVTCGSYTERDSIYGFDDDLQRFTYFSRAALEFMFKTNRRPDIIHCHDWATSLVPAMLWDIYEPLGWNNSRVVYTIHNNECQGLCGFGDKLLGLVGMDAKHYHRPDRMQDDAHPNCINMMKGAIVYSNFVTTVSPTYAGELKTVAGGRGLQNTIAKNSAKVGGVLNGIDYDSWNPQTDGKIAARYSAGDDFAAKYENKRALREWLGMWDAWKPTVSVVTRLTHQKGLDLIKHAIFKCQELQAQFVLLGSAPDPKVNNEFLALQHQLRDNHDVNLYIGYNEDLSHLIYAGSDMFLVPSLYEPCGLTQMISLRYGTVPIVRETGGLVDSVFDLDNSGRGLNNANGFTFRDASPVSLDYGLSRAVRLWHDNPEAFNRLARNGMKYDYSWRHPAEHYENIYNYIKA